MDILVTVEGQKMKLASNQTHHIEGSSQFVKFVFDLSDEWVGLDTNVQFIQNGEAYGQKLDGSGNKKYAFLPNGITEGECKMVLYGGDGTIRATTNYIPLSIGKDISALRTLSENISRTDYEQALNELKQYVANGGVTEIALNQAFSNAVNEIATEENVKQEIASGITIAKSEIESAKASIENAKTEISNSVATVKEYANGVQEIINSAETIKNEANEALVNANEALSNANTALATAKDAIEARDEIIGKTGSAKSPEPKSALGEIRQARKDILGDDGAEGIVETVTALKNQAEAAKGEAVQSAEAAATSEKNVKAIESKIDQANTSAAQIESFRTEMTTAHTAVINARNDILAKGDDNKSVYDKIIDAKTSINSSKDLIIGSDGLIIGSDGTVTAPGKGSALDKAQKAQEAAEAAQEAAVQARNEAEGFAASANNGITVINSLNSTDTANALSANQGRVLNEKIANLNEIYIMKSGETEADVPKSVEVIIMPEESGTPYVLTDSDKSEIASLVKAEVPLVKSAEQPIFANSIDECTDTTKLYVLPDGYIYAFKSATTEQEVNVTDNIVGTIENPYETGRLSPGGTLLSDISTHTLTPYIDLTKAEYLGKTIELHLEGNRYVSETAETYIQMAIYKADKSVINGRTYTCLDKSKAILPVLTNVSTTINDTTSTTLTITIPAKYNDTEIGYMRFCGLGLVTDSVYITYTKTQTVTSEQWVNTGILYGGSGGEIDEATAAKISALNNEGADPASVKLLSAPVMEFYNSEAYSDDDYTVSHLSKITYPCRADMPVPYTVKWGHNENAMRTTVAIDTKAISNSNAYTMRTYDATGVDKYPIFNLLPNTTYYYKVTHVFADGSLVEAKSGSFTTSSESIRLIYIDGTQNVRDLGGWTGLNGKKVKYGKIFRGAAFSDSSYPGLMLTGKGRLALGELKIQAELNLGAIDTATSIAANCSYKKIGYTNYAIAITDETRRAQFKEALEWIVSCLDGTLTETGLYTVERNIYMHCQGGCDRTGTLSFLLLGLLGVSESDLAKEYELSSFSDVGFGRLRTTTKAVDTYDYVGMVEALKTYSGDTITDKFVSFATTGCGISIDTITSFRNLMLE